MSAASWELLRGVPGYATLKDAFFTMPGAVYALSVVVDLPLDPARVRKAARVQRLADLGPRQVREMPVSSLLDREMLLRHPPISLESDCILWIVPVDELGERDLLEETLPRLVVRLVPLSSSGRCAYGLQTAAVARSLLQGGPRSPAAPETPGTEAMFQSFTGMDSARVPADIVRLLEEQGVELRKRSRLTRLLGNPRMLVYVIVFVYSVVRALSVVFVNEFHGSLVILWSIDVITAIPYTWGVLAMVLAPRRSIRALGFLVTATTFMLPYVYFWWNGNDYPAYVLVVIGATILAGIALEMKSGGINVQVR